MECWKTETLGITPHSNIPVSCPTPNPLHPTPCVLHPTRSTLHPGFYALRPSCVRNFQFALCTFQFAMLPLPVPPCALTPRDSRLAGLHYALCALHLEPCALYLAPCTFSPTPHSLPFPLCPLRPAAPGIKYSVPGIALGFFALRSHGCSHTPCAGSQDFNIPRTKACTGPLTYHRPNTRIWAGSRLGPLGS